MNSSPSDHDPGAAAIQRHVLGGWSLILVFATVGVMLETLHALKAPVLLDVDHETRRMLWRLGHAHGTLLGLLHLAWAFTLSRIPGRLGRTSRAAGTGLWLASVLLPLGFLLGGVDAHAGDPGLGIVLVPLGAAALLLSLALSVWAVSRRS